jgi:large subunit ribosomal protein L25
MSEVIELAVEPRERAGKGPARAARRAGRVPAVIYGAKKDPALITLGGKEIGRQLESTGFFATLFDLDLGGQKERVLPRDIQYDPVTDRVIHVDFLRVSAETSVTVQVPVIFLNESESPGLVGGGVLNVVRHEIELACRADAIPHEIAIDLSGLEVGDGVHISMVTLPDGVAPTITDRDFTIATIAAPKLHVEEEEAEEGEVEGEEGLEGVEGEEGEEAAADGEKAGEATEE